MGVPDELFDNEFEAVKQAANVSEDVGLSADNLKQISERFLRVFQGAHRPALSRGPVRATGDRDQGGVPLMVGQACIVDYRREFKITPDMANGTAVNILHHGIRQPRKRFGDRCRLHPQSGHRGRQAVRRIPGQCPG